MPYMGKVDVKASDIKRFDVTGSTSATHTLSWTAPSEQSLIITINGVKQQDSAYTISGSPTTITLASALVATDEMEVIGINDIGQTNTVAQDSIVTDMIRNDAVTSAKLDTNITIDGTFDVGSYLSVDSSGRVTMPNQPYFHAYGTGNTAYGTGTHVLGFGSTHYNVGGHYNTSTSRFTAPIAGNYMFCFMARVDGSDTNYFRTLIRQNGNSDWTVGHQIKDLGQNWDPRYYSWTGTVIYALAANDYIDVAIVSQSDTSITHYHSESSFYGILLS